MTNSIAWRDYQREYIKKRRRHFRELYLKRKIAYKDIPKSYRYFKDTL